MAGGGGKPPLAVGAGRRGKLAEAHGAIHEHAGRLARRVAQQAPAHRVAGRGADAESGHGAGVDQRRMAVDPGQPDRVIGNRLREELVSGEGLVGPTVLIPAAAAQPGPGRQPAGSRTHPPDDLVVARRAVEIDLVELLSEAGEMGVGVDQPRRDGASGEVDQAGRGAAQGGGPRVVPEVDDAAAAHRQAALDRLGRLNRVEHAVHQDEVGHVLRMGWVRHGKHGCDEGEPERNP